ncbi:hypothetical protein SK128_001677 [Halocaridina rubra]|uniref:C2H2-type domain-containing protein n=1 Tax=Halocaridina rubra TaxID=373956 RepID=A0AAN8WS30_HALRR
MAKKSYQCLQCGKQYVLKSSLKTHKLNHGSECTYKCARCLLTFVEARAYHLHLTNKACENKLRETSEQVGKNVFCNANDSQDRQSLLKGLQKLKVYKRRFRCLYCSTTFLEKSVYQDHLNKHESITRTSVGSEDVNISHLYKNMISFRPDDDLSVAYEYCEISEIDKSEKNQRTFECSVCQKAFTLGEELDSHTILHHSERFHSVPSKNPNTVFHCDQKSSDNESGHPDHSIQHDSCSISIFDRTSKAPAIINWTNEYSQSTYNILYKCMNCPVICLNETEMRIHNLNHTEYENSLCKDQLQQNEKENNISLKDLNCGRMLAYPVISFHKFFKCLSCPMVFLTKVDVEKHVSVHIKDNVSYGGGNINDCIKLSVACECPICITFFATVEELESHVVCHEHVDLYQSHLCANLSEEGNQCLVINIVNIEENIIRVDNNNHDDVLSKQKELQEVSRVEHNVINNIHNAEQYKCIVCQKEFTNKKKFNDHKRIHIIKRHVCNKCGKKFRALSYLKEHLYSHSEVRPYKCIQCLKHFKSIHALKLHAIVHSKARLPRCSVCNLSFKYKYSLTLHELYHCKKDIRDLNKGDTCKNDSNILHTFVKDTNIEHFIDTSSQNGTANRQCCYCRKSFLTKSSFLLHQRKIGKHPYLCCVCQKCFALKSTLKNHLDLHAEFKKYLCHICGAKFAQRQTLNSHLRKHSNYKRFVCNECGIFNCPDCEKVFKLESSLTSHLKIKSGGSTNMCLTCNKSFSRRACLTHHKKKHSQEARDKEKHSQEERKESTVIGLVDLHLTDAGILESIDVAEAIDNLDDQGGILVHIIA